MDEVKKGSGLRFNSGKLRYDLVHPWAHEQMIKILTKGDLKYNPDGKNPRNWEKGMKWSTVIASLKRHLAEIEKGEDYDTETGELHVAHLACNTHFLTAYYKIFPEGDDRPHMYLKRPKIGLDIDEVLCDFIGGWADIWGEHYKPLFWTYDPKMKERFRQMKNNGTLEEFYLGLEAKIDPKELNFEPHCYITSRPCKTETTLKWLVYKGFPSRPIYTVELGQSKAEVIKQSGCEWFVDDGYHNFVELNNAGICTFLFSAPHNEKYDVGFKRIKSLEELV